MRAERILELMKELDQTELDNLWTLTLRHGIQFGKTLPHFAYAEAKEAGGSAALRQLASQDPRWALEYAKEVDKANHPVTRQGVSTSPEYAFKYARQVEGRHDVTRLAACRDPQCALAYAQRVDRVPSSETRTAACQSPEMAFHYAREVDKAPGDQTRRAACQDPYWALKYATDLEFYHPDTWAAVQGTGLEVNYIETVGRIPPEIRQEHWEAQQR